MVRPKPSTNLQIYKKDRSCLCFYVGMLNVNVLIVSTRRNGRGCVPGQEPLITREAEASFDALKI